MRHLFTAGAIALLALGLSAPLAVADEPPEITLETDAQKGSYLTGLIAARQVFGGDLGDLDRLDKALLIQGFTDALDGEARIDLEGNEELYQSFVTALVEDMEAARAAERDDLAASNLSAGRAFLAEKAEEPGVVATGSGLLYRVIEMGDGPVPTATDTVSVHYVGTLIDGTEFDSSISRGAPTQFPVNGVIRGWTEALELMPVGSKWQLYIPTELAYSSAGFADLIGPNEVLVFQVELLEIVE